MTVQPSMLLPDQVCAVVLAGGRASRMNGVDKGLQNLHGQALALHAVQRLQAQTLGTPGLIAISANRHLDTYATWGHPVWPDAMQGFAGPLAGFHTALLRCQEAPHAYAYLLVVPCDSPRFPLDLLERLAQGLVQARADVAVAAIVESDADDGQALRQQPVFCLMRSAVQGDLQHYLAQGGRKIDTWIGQQRSVVVRFDGTEDDPNDFFNANTMAQLQQLE